MTNPSPHDHAEESLTPPTADGSVDKSKQRMIVAIILAVAAVIGFAVIHQSSSKKVPKAIENATKAPNAKLTGTNAISQYQQNLDANIAQSERANQSPTPAGPAFGTLNPSPANQVTQFPAPGTARPSPDHSLSAGNIGAPGYGPVTRQEANFPTSLPAKPSAGDRPFYMDPQQRAAYAYGPNSPQAAMSPSGAEREQDELARDHQKRIYMGRYLSNIAFTKRTDKDAKTQSASTTAATSQPRPFPVPGNIQSADATQQTIAANVQATSQAFTAANNRTSEADARAQRLEGVAQGAPTGEKKRPTRTPGTYLIPEGTTVSCVLQNRLNGDFAGPVKVMVSEPVYDRARERILIPAGTIFLGDEKGVAKLGQERLAVSFHRLLRPDGYTADLDTFTGLNQIGETALKDKVNHHYIQVFGISIALGAIAGLSNATTNAGYNQTGNDQFKQGFSQSLDSSAMRILDRYINILPTVVIREGTRVKVYFTNDLYLPSAELNPILD